MMKATALIFALLQIQGFFATPTFEIIATCPEEWDLCINMKTNSGNWRMINLDQKYDDNECLFEGSFEDDDNSMVVVSSDDCPIDEDSELKISFTSGNDYGYYQVDPLEDVSVQQIKLPQQMDAKLFDEPLKVPSNLTLTPGKGQSGGQQEMKAGEYKLNMCVYYDNYWKSYYGSSSKSKVEETFAHSNVWYHHNSLESKMSLNVKKVSKVDENMQASGDWLDWARDIHLPGEEDVCDLYHYMTVYMNGGAIGIAWLGVVCIDDIGYKAGITGLYEIGSPAENDAYLAIVLSHEIGHNLNMYHDFDQSGGPGVTRPCQRDGSSCTDIGGIMDYWQDPHDKWTCCSNADFEEWYDYVVGQVGGFCLEPMGGCEDKGKEKKCKKLAKKGKCSKKKVAKKCQKSCGLC